MHRSLRFQLTVIVVATVATILLLSQWAYTRLSEFTLEEDLKERALLALRSVDLLWRRGSRGELRREIVMLAESDREITAIDLFRLRDGACDIDMTSRKPPEEPPTVPPAEQILRLADGGTVGKSRADAHGTDRWRILIPLRREDAIVGAVQVELSLAEVARLKRRLRVINTLVLGASVAIISLTLAFFLERRVARPVAALARGMRRAERNERGVRVEVTSGEEFGLLAHSFNRMLARIEDLTGGLERRVHEATEVLAEKNRELQALNERLERAQVEIGHSERLAALGQMAGTIAHELGTPLNSVLGYVQLLLREDLPPDQVQKLAIVESQVQRMIETIRSVLDRTRDRPARRQPVAVGQLVNEALALVSARLAARNLTAHVEIPSDLPAVPGDAVALRQALLNLLTNAIDATEPPGTITVSARLQARDNQRGRCVELAVRDTGHGMSADELRYVFEPFYTTKAPGRGSGLGLVIVDHIVQAHGGQLIVDSEPGKGTTMQVRLPLEA